MDILILSVLVVVGILAVILIAAIISDLLFNK